MNVNRSPGQQLVRILRRRTGRDHVRDRVLSVLLHILHRATTPIGVTSGLGAIGRVTAPSSLPQTVGAFVRAEIAAKGGPESWKDPAHAHFVREADGWRLTANRPLDIRTGFRHWHAESSIVTKCLRLIDYLWTAVL